MKKKRENYSWELRAEVVERMRRGERVAHLSRELGIGQSVLYEWRSKAEPWASAPVSLESASSKEIRRLKARISELEGTVGREVLEKDFFASALRRVAARGASSTANGSKTSGLRSAAGWERKAD